MTTQTIAEEIGARFADGQTFTATDTGETLGDVLTDYEVEDHALPLSGGEPVHVYEFADGSLLYVDSACWDVLDDEGRTAAGERVFLTEPVEMPADEFCARVGDDLEDWAVTCFWMVYILPDGEVNGAVDGTTYGALDGGDERLRARALAVAIEYVEEGA